MSRLKTRTGLKFFKSLVSFFKSPASLVVILLASFTLVSVIFNSCDQTVQQTGYPSDSLLKALQKPVTLGPAEEEIKQLNTAVKPQSEQLIAAINKDYPGLYQKYEAAVKELVKLKGAEEIKRATDKLDADYKKQFMEAYVKSGVGPQVLEAYKKALSKYEYKVGDLGTITIVSSQKPVGDVIFEPRPMPIIYAFSIFSLMGCNGSRDTTLTFACPLDIHERNTTCSLIGLDFITSAENCRCSAGNDGLFFGGCGAISKIGRNIDVNGSVVNITSTFNGNYYLHAMAIAIIGGSYGQATIGSEILEGSTLKQRNEFSRVWAVAPLIWYTDAVETRTNQNLVTSFTRTATSGNFTITAKIYCEASTGAGLIAGAHGFSSLSAVNSLRVQLQH